MKSWADSETWRNSAMQNNEWADLPLPVLDLIFRGLYFFDLRSSALVCKKWSAATTQKIPYTRQVFRHQAEQKIAARENARQLRIQQRRQAVKDTLSNLGTFALMSIPFLLCLMIGLTGILFFLDFVKTVSIVPDCPYAYSMTTALYCCCAFWLLDALLFFVWALICSFNPNPWGAPADSWRRKLTFEFVFRICNGIGVFANLGIWSSAAACVHFCNACMDLNPFVAVQVRAFAATSLAVGLAINVLGIWFQALVA
jgi:hypothetical protein